MRWALQDLEFLSPLVGLVALMFGIRWAERRMKKQAINITIHGKAEPSEIRKAVSASLRTQGVVHDLPPKLTDAYANPALIGTERKADVERTATDWGARLGVLLNDLTADGFVVLLDTDRDEIIIAPRRYKGGNHLAKVQAKSDGTGWELK
jgi:hypothetical protein